MKPKEHPADRLARLLGMGEYGEKLAREILGDYKSLIETELGSAGYVRASDYLWREFEPTWELGED